LFKAFIIAVIAYLLMAVSGVAGVETSPGMLPNASNAVLPTARQNLNVGNWVAPEDMGLGCLATGTVDCAPALNAAAQVVANGYAVGVRLQAGTYLLNETVNTQGARIQGAGMSATLVTPPSSGDAFYCAKSPTPAQYIFGCDFSDFKIYTAGNPSSGAGIHWVGASKGSARNVIVIGMFYNFWQESSLYIEYDNTIAQGTNSNTGSAHYVMDQYGSLGNNNFKMIHAEGFGPVSASYNYGLVINNVDGAQIEGSHFGHTSVADILLQPVNTNDPIDNLLVLDTVLDPSSEYGVSCPSTPGGYTANFGQITFAGGTFHAHGVAGFYNACGMSDVHLAGETFLDMGGYAVEISAGDRFDLSGVIFDESNCGGGSASDVSLTGGTDFVLDGAQYRENSGCGGTPAYHVLIGGSADHISMLDQHFSGASTGNLTWSSWTGSWFRMTYGYTDKGLAIGTCGSSETCQINGGSGPNQGDIQFSPSASVSSGSFTLTFPDSAYATPHRWGCSFTPKTVGANAWPATSTVNITGGNATSTVIGTWNTNGSAMASSGVFMIHYVCDID
jgi:hypothetical protein